jgi:alkanesulfonate monooxygenase SsuD/methylene tetrahydromethanopterin reductase-like flavin-dependent oxidoreductase (luciferase family)
LSAVAQATERIGLAGTASTSFIKPYLLARQLKALDVISYGRVGWNAIPSYEPDAFANFAKELPARENKYVGLPPQYGLDPHIEAQQQEQLVDR